MKGRVPSHHGQFIVLRAAPEVCELLRSPSRASARTPSRAHPPVASRPLLADHAQETLDVGAPHAQRGDLAPSTRRSSCLPALHSAEPGGWLPLGPGAAGPLAD